MPPPDKYDQIWSVAVQQYPELASRWGVALPRDAAGEPETAALMHHLELRKRPPAPTPAPVGTQPTPGAQPAVAVEDPSEPGRYRRWVAGVEDPGTPAEPPRPVDWGQRFKDIGAGLAQIAMYPATQSEWLQFLPGMKTIKEKQEQARSEMDPEATGFKKYLQKGVTELDPLFGAFQAGQDITSPLRGALYAYTPTNVPFELAGGQMPGFGESSVRRWYGELRDQGYGHFESLQAAAEQAEREGTVSGIQELGGKIVTDPFEAIPTVGIYGGLTRAAGRALRSGAKEVAEEVPEAAARQLVDEGAVQEPLPIFGKRPKEGEQLSVEYQPSFGAAPQRVPKESFKPLPGVEGVSVNVDEVINYNGRDMVVVNLSDGRFQPFYRRTGRGGPAERLGPGEWAPFDGIVEKSPMPGLFPDGWINKAAYVPQQASYEQVIKDPLFRLGTEENRIISNALKRIEESLPESRTIKSIKEANEWLGVSGKLEEQGPGIGGTKWLREAGEGWRQAVGEVEPIPTMPAQELLRQQQAQEVGQLQMFEETPDVFRTEATDIGRQQIETGRYKIGPEKGKLKPLTSREKAQLQAGRRAIETPETYTTPDPETFTAKSWARTEADPQESLAVHWKQVQADGDPYSMSSDIVASEVRQTINFNEVDDLIANSPEAAGLVDELLNLRVRGDISTHWEKGMFKNQKTLRAAELIFGNRKKASVDKLDKYLDSKSQVDFKLEVNAGMNEMMMDLKTRDWGRITNDTLEYFEQTPDGKWVEKATGTPASASGGVGYRGALVEAGNKTRAELRSHGAKDGDPIQVMESTPDFQRFSNEGGNVSDWIRDSDFGIANRRIVDAESGTLKKMATLDELKGFEGKGGYFNLKKTTQQLHKTLLRDYASISRLHEMNMDHVITEGRRELTELGWFDKDGAVTDLGLGTIQNPGPVRILYYALHNPRDWLHVLRGKYGARGEQQYWNLKTLVKWEEANTVRSGELLLDTKEDYFYRGFTYDDKNWETIKANLGRIPSYKKARAEQSFQNLHEAGLNPLFWNPYEQAMIRSRMGVQSRLATQLIELLKDESLGMATLARTPTEKANLIDDGYRDLRNVGPAFKEEKFLGVSKIFEKGYTNPKTGKVESGIINVDEQANLVEPVWMFPKGVANSLEEMFGAKPEFYKMMTKEGRIPIIGKNIKMDDLIFLPKRMKLFASLFQQTDFALRIGYGSHQSAVNRMWDALDMVRKGRGGEVEVGKVLYETMADMTLRWPSGWLKMAKANLLPSYRKNLASTLRSRNAIFSDNPNITWAGMVENGLHVKDTTILNVEESIKLMDQTVKKHGFLRRTFRKMENYMQEGLFDGVYPAAIMHDVQYNILPYMRNLYGKNMSDTQIMANAAKVANIKWSTIPVEQSVFNGWSRDVIERGLFSLNEFEAGGRMLTGLFRGENKRFWLTHWMGVFMFTSMVGSIIHLMTTALTRKDEETGEVKWDLDISRAEMMPKDRYFKPFHTKGWYTLGYGYNPEFMSPDLPLPTRSGDRAMLDMMMQMDFAFRMTDGSSGFPLTQFMSSRLGTMPRAIKNQMTGEDYMGRDIGEWGLAQKMLQFVYDTAAPIGAGQLSTALARNAFKDKDLPHLNTPFFTVIAPGANIEKLTPSVEGKLGGPGIAIQGLGLNLKTKSNDNLRDDMTEKIFDGNYPGYEGLVLKTWSKLEKHPDKEILRRIVYDDPRNARELREIGERQKEGALYWYDDFSKMMADRRKISEKRLEDQTIIVERNTKMLWQDATDPNRTAWSPTTFKEETKAASANRRGMQEGIDLVYGSDPRVAVELEKLEKPPDRASEPLTWAIWKYYNTKKEFTDKTTGKLDRKFYNEWDKITASWADESDDSGMPINTLLERFEAWQSSGNHHPFYDEYYEAVGKIADSGYWQVGPEQAGDKFDVQLKSLQDAYGYLLPETLDAGTVWNSYLQAPNEEKSRLRAHQNWGIKQVIDTMVRLKRAHRYDVVMQNPQIDQLLIKWYRTTPYLPENKNFFLLLYRKLPSSTRRR